MTNPLKWIVMAVAVLGFYAYSVVGQSHPVVSSTSSGRYQVVNGTPELSKNIMLLDTATGRSWILCRDESKSDLWCTLEVSEASDKSQ